MDDDEDASYLSQFRRHLAEVQAHFAGEWVSNRPPSNVPTLFWTQCEKDSFFHGLAVYSRLRPDLIAACVGTKTVLDVCMYMDLLDEALSQRKQPRVTRRSLEPALEVSDEWVQWEERAAEDLVDFEEDRLSFLQSSRVSMNPVAGPETVECDSGGDHATRRVVESILCRLSPEHLRVMEAILNEAESEDQKTAATSTPTTTITPSSSPLLLPGQVSTDPASRRRVSEAPEQYPPHERRAGNTPVSIVIPHLALDNASFLGHSDTPGGSGVRASSSPSPGTVLVAEDEPPLSPASRRRLQKRLYMRRQRALRTGQSVILGKGKLRPGRKTAARSATATSESESSKQGGSRTGSREVDSDVDGPGENATNAGYMSPPPCDDDDPDKGSHQPERTRSKGGLTRFYKIKKEFTLNGIDAETLREGQLGLFHLSAVNRLMMSGYDLSSISAISADTLRLMSAIVIEFTTEVVRRAITLREQERYMKDEIKVYGPNIDEITSEVVACTLNMMGMKGVTKMEYFAQLLGNKVIEPPEEGDDHSMSSASTCSGTETEGDDDDDESRDDDGDLFEPDMDPAAFPARLSLPRELYLPLVHLPKTLRHCQPRGESTEAFPEETLMPLEMDQIHEEQELEEEFELDEADMVLSRECEAGLWSKIPHLE